MGFCWQCFEKMSSDLVECPKCGFEHVFELGNKRISLVIPGESVEEGVKQLCEQVSKDFFELKKELNDFRNSFESGRSTGMTVDISPFLFIKRELKKLSISTALKDEDLKKVLIFLYMVESIDSNLKKRFGRFANPSYGFHQAIYRAANFPENGENNLVEFMSRSSGNATFNSRYGILVSDITENIIDRQQTEIHPLCYIAFNKSRVQHEKFQAHLAHELTHASIYANTNYSATDQPVLRAIDEACCNVVTELYFPGFFDINDEGKFVSMSVQYYREKKNMPKSVLISSIKAFQKAMEKVDGTEDEKIDALRKTGINAINKMKGGHITPHEAILGDKDLKEEFENIRSFEIAEYRLFHSLLLLGIVDEDLFKEYKSWSKDISEGLDIESERDSNMIIEKDLEVMNNSLPEIQRLVAQTQGEMKENLEALYSNLKELIDRRENEKDFLRHPFCPSCGRVVKPGANYCTKCGNDVKPRERENLETEMSYVVENTYTGRSFLLTREKLRNNNHREVVANLRILLEFGLKENNIIKNVLEKIHGEEEPLAQFLRNQDLQEFEKIENLIKSTEEAYQLCKRAEQNMKRSEDLLQKIDSREN